MILAFMNCLLKVLLDRKNPDQFCFELVGIFFGFLVSFSALLYFYSGNELRATDSCALLHPENHMQETHVIPRLRQMLGI